jgi:hypothetical protein
LEAALRRMRRRLLAAARSGEKVTYGQLMRECSLSRGRPLTGAIGSIDRDEQKRGSPGFAAIIVRKDTGFPGGGYFCDDDLPSSLRRPPSRSSDPRLSPLERTYVVKMQKRIWAHYSTKA